MLKHRTPKRFAQGFVLSLLAVAASAAPPVIPGYRMAAPPTIDGTIHEESEWKDVPTISGLVDEVTGERTPDGAKFWIAYDDKFVYIAARMGDRQPNLIRAAQYQTNVSVQGDDYLQVDLDLSGSLADFNVFQVNPRGATNIQLAGGRAAKREWAGEFHAASRITPTGWETEMRIPWQVMPLPSSGRRNVRVMFERSIARFNRLYSVVYFNLGASNNTPIWQGVELPRGEVDRTIKLLPYTYAGYDPDTKGIFNSGLDLKTSLTDQIKVVGSVNPDFRNIENQILSLDFSHFQRLASESRPFFLEGSQYLGSALFSSQLIPRFDAGLNSYGKLNDKTSYGFLDAITFGRQNNLVANATYDPDPTNSYRAGITALDQSGIHNSAYLARYQHNWGPYGLFLRDMGSHDNLQGQGDNANVEGFYFGKFLQFFGEYTRVTPNFNPRLGFFSEVDFKGYDGTVSYVRPWAHGPWSEFDLNTFYLVFDHVNGEHYRRDSSYQAQGLLRNGLGFTLTLDTDQFDGSDDHLTTATVAYPQGNPYNQVSTTYAWGREVSVGYRSITFNVNRRLFNRLQLIGRYQAVDYGGFNDQAILDANCDIGHDQAVYGRLTKQGTNVNGYLAYRRSGNLGTEYYLIVGDPNALTFRASVILKVVIPLDVKMRR